MLSSLKILNSKIGIFYNRYLSPRLFKNVSKKGWFTAGDLLKFRVGDSPRNGSCRYQLKNDGHHNKKVHGARKIFDQYHSISVAKNHPDVDLIRFFLQKLRYPNIKNYYYFKRKVKTHWNDNISLNDLKRSHFWSRFRCTLFTTLCQQLNSFWRHFLLELKLRWQN